MIMIRSSPLNWLVHNLDLLVVRTTMFFVFYACILMLENIVIALTILVELDPVNVDQVSEEDRNTWSWRTSLSWMCICRTFMKVYLCIEFWVWLFSAVSIDVLRIPDWIGSTCTGCTQVPLESTAQLIEKCIQVAWNECVLLPRCPAKMPLDTYEWFHQ